MSDSTRDEWDLFAAVHRSLQAGQKVVTFRQSVPFEQPSDGNYGYATDEEGVEYDLSSNFIDVLNTCIRDYKISYSVTRESNFYTLFQFGYNLKAAPTTESDEGFTTINLLELDPNDPQTHVIFEQIQQSINGDGEDDEGEEWKRLLDTEE